MSAEGKNQSWQPSSHVQHHKVLVADEVEPALEHDSG
jgi:hypothetical protein